MIFYEIHILDGDIFGCEADNCLDPGNSELVERIFRPQEPGDLSYAIMHAKDWSAIDNDRSVDQQVDAEIEVSL